MRQWETYKGAFIWNLQLGLPLGLTKGTWGLTKGTNKEDIQRLFQRRLTIGTYIGDTQRGLTNWTYKGEVRQGITKETQ